AIPSPLDPAPLRRAATVVRDRRDVGDRRDLEARRLERADRRLAAGARTTDEDLDRAEALVHRLARRVLRRDLRRVRGALAGALPAGGAGRGPRDHVPLRIGERDDRVVERGLDVRGPARHGPLLALAARRGLGALGGLLRGLLGLFLAHVRPFSSLLRLRRGLLLAGDRLARPAAGPRVRAGPLAAHR